MRTAVATLVLLAFALSAAAQTAAPASIFGFPVAAAKEEIEREQQFLAIPNSKLAEQHLRVLTAAPHLAASPEDRRTADYVAERFREAGLETEIVEYRVWLNYPAEVSVDITAPAGVHMHGPTREHVDGDDPYQDDPRVVTPFSGSSPSGDVEAEVVYANYGRPEDLEALRKLGIDVHGKILLERYGSNFRGVKAFVAQESGAAGVLLYSDPMEDGWFKGDAYPDGPWRPASGVQRGSIGYIFEFPGDPTTPGIASVPGVTEAQRTPLQQSAAMPKIPTTPLSYHDAWPILQHLAGSSSPRGWQGALPFTYHVGPGPVRVRLHLKLDYALRTIWDVVGTIKGSQWEDGWVVTGNHRDAWVYGAADPGSGTAAMLEMVHGLGQLLKTGWRPKRTIVLGSWDAEEEGLIGSTEWAEQNAPRLANAVAYFNADVAVAGPSFSAAAVPSLKQFVRDIAKAVPSAGGDGPAATVYSAWSASASEVREHPNPANEARNTPAAETTSDVPVGDLGSGSDFTVFFQHLGVPAADFGSSGSYGVYHSVFDNFAWFKKFIDPQFAYERQQACFWGLEIMRMADAEALPYDYEEYGRELRLYLESAQRKARAKFGGNTPSFDAARSAAQAFLEAGTAIRRAQANPPADATALNHALSAAERGFLLPEGLPGRPWYKHAIYAPGRYSGYSAVVLPGVTEAIDKGDVAGTESALRALTAAIERAAQTLAAYRPAS